MNTKLQLFLIDRNLTGNEFCLKTKTAYKTFNNVLTGKTKGTPKFWHRVKYAFNLTNEEVLDLMRGG